MDPILIFTDTSRLNEALRQHSVHLADLNEILTDYGVLGLSSLLGEEFQSLVRDPATTIYDKMTGGSPAEINGMPINRAKVMELLQKPAGYDALLEIIDSFKKHRPHWDSILHNVDVVSGKVVLNASVVTAETIASKVFLTTDNEKNLYDFAQAVIAAAGTHLGGVKYNLSELIERTVYRNVNPVTTTGIDYKIKPTSFRGFMN